MATSRVLNMWTIGLCFFAIEASVQAQIFGPGPSPRSSDIQQTSAHLEGAQAGDAQRSGWPSIPLPRVTMPKVTMPNMSVVFEPVKSGYSKVTAGTKKAWAGTKEMLTFGQASDSSTYGHRATAPKPSFWQRLVGREPEPRGPQTVAEWMSQPRLDP